MFDFPDVALSRRELLSGRRGEKFPARLPRGLEEHLRTFANANGLSVNGALVELAAMALLVGPKLQR